MEDLAYWINLFHNARLPSVTGKKYASLFLENRMTVKLLRYLDKDLLKEMGITAVGDIITILQHCKTIDFDKEETNVKISTSTAVSSTTPETEKPKLLSGHELPVPLKRRVSKEIEGKYKIKQPLGTTEKTKRILEQIKSTRPLKSNLLDIPSSSRVVIIKATSSSLTPLQSSHQEHAQSGSDSDENVKVIISSSKSDVQTANLGKQNNPSVFGRLGAESKRHLSITKSLNTDKKESKSILSRVIHRTLTNQGTATNVRSSNFDKVQQNSLKRTISGSVFSRLGVGNDHLSNNIYDCLDYQGVFKQARLSDDNLSKTTSCKESPRISAKNRLGSQETNDADIIRPKSAGILTSYAPKKVKTVHDRISWPNGKRL